MAKSCRFATKEDVSRITSVVNWAYRGKEGGKSGWTGEKHLVEGARISEKGVEELLSQSQYKIMVCELVRSWLFSRVAFKVLYLIVIQDEVVVGVIKLDFDEEKKEVEFGMFAVDPDVQGKVLALFHSNFSYRQRIGSFLLEKSIELAKVFVPSPHSQQLTILAKTNEGGVYVGHY